MGTAFEETTLPGVILCKPELFGDDRGFFTETYQKYRYITEGVKANFVQDNLSRSKKGTLRGLHYQLAHPQAKLVSVLKGEVLDVAVDIRRGSPNYGMWTAHTLNDENRHQLFIPAGFAHGFCVLSETADFYYKCSDVYYPNDQYGLMWNDSSFGIEWGVDQPLLSEKDQSQPTLQTIPEENLPVMFDL